MRIWSHHNREGNGHSEQCGGKKAARPQEINDQGLNCIFQQLVHSFQQSLGNKLAVPRQLTNAHRCTMGARSWVMPRRNSESSRRCSSRHVCCTWSGQLPEGWAQAWPFGPRLKRKEVVSFCTRQSRVGWASTVRDMGRVPGRGWQSEDLSIKSTWRLKANC